jgi:hypothetical protein
MPQHRMLTVTISIDFGSESRPPIEQNIAVLEGSTVLDVLRIVVPIATSCKFGMDDFVEEIAGIQNEFAIDRGWHFEVNGYRSNVPAERYLVKGGDLINWLYIAAP